MVLLRWLLPLLLCLERGLCCRGAWIVFLGCRCRCVDSSSLSIIIVIVAAAATVDAREEISFVGGSITVIQVMMKE